MFPPSSEGLQNNEAIPDEIEFKILDIDPESIVTDLEEFNAVKVFDGIIEDFYFDSKENVVREAGCRLRVRHTIQKDPETGEEKEVFTVVFKGKKEVTEDGYPKRPETNGLTVPTFNESIKTVRTLIKQHIDSDFEGDVKPVFHIKKKRVGYSIDDINVDIDQYQEVNRQDISSSIPPLVEFETFNERLLPDVEDLVRSLGLEVNEEHKHFSTNDVIKHYRGTEFLERDF